LLFANRAEHDAAGRPAKYGRGFANISRTAGRTKRLPAVVAHV
jgi:hypothetical protein